MTYKTITVTARGGSDCLKIVENDLRSPAAGEARIRVLATTVCQDDIAARVGNRPFLPKIPFVPGYAIVGCVDALGEGVTQVAVGDRVAALINFGGWSEFIYLAEKTLMPVPPDLDPAQVIPLMLNYLTAYQSLHRVAHVKAGDTALIIGASGGVGTALAELGRLAGLKMFGLASPAKHAALAELGITPIDYHTQDFVEVIGQAEPGGIDFVFNGMGEEAIERGLAVLRRGGVLVHYGGPQSMARFVLLVWKIILYNLLPNGKAVKGYGTHTVDMKPLKEDWAILFKLLGEGKINPVISHRFPILEAAAAGDVLESGKVTGSIVLLAPELLQK